MSKFELQDLEDLQKLLVDPVVAAVREEVRSVIAYQQSHAARLTALEGNQKKALLGFAGLTVLISSGWGIGFNWIKQKVGL
jgi:hypothetical protein